MSLLSQLASQVGDRSQAANRQVAAQCSQQPEHLQEIVAGLQSTNVALLGDCLEVLCKVAESQPHAVVPYAPALAPLLTHKTMRVRWETAHTLALLATHVPQTISSMLPSLAHQLHTDSSTIVRDYIIDTLSAYATTGTSAAQAVFPLLEMALVLWAGKHAGRALQGLFVIARAVPGSTAQICHIADRFRDDPRTTVRKGEGLRVFIGVAEILAAVGLILPGLTRILLSLTALAAAGLMIVMSSATVLHLIRGEIASAISTLVILMLVSVVAYTRWKVQPIVARKRS